MRQDRLKIAGVGAALVVLSLGQLGCSVSRPVAIGTSGNRALTPGTVDLDALTLHNPEYLLVQETDAALAMYADVLNGAHASTVQSNVAMAQQFVPETSGLGPNPGYSESDLTARLQSSDANRLTDFTQRLSEAGQLALNAAKVDIAAQQAKDFETQRVVIERAGFATVRSILSADAQHRLTLNMQIGALTHNANKANPATAPDDYWGTKLVAKKAELATLDARRVYTLAGLHAKENVLIDQLTANLAKRTADQIAQAAAEIENRDNLRVTGYRGEMDARRSEIVETAREYDNDAALAFSAPGEGAMNVSNGPFAEAIVNKTAETQWRSRLASTIATLTAQRARQVLLVREETRRTVLEVAGKQRFEIVGWQSSTKRQDLTARVLANLKDRGWT